MAPDQARHGAVGSSWPVTLFARQPGRPGGIHRTMRYNILYRGPLSSCNYACSYCPFAKRTENHADLEQDRLALDRFVQWLTAQDGERFGVLFTPWGEALIRRWYQEALGVLTHLPHVERAAIQTNLSCGLH